MLGAIIGDIAGSIYEHKNIKTKKFPLFSEGCRFTDDTVCTIAVADCMVNSGDFSNNLKSYVNKHPSRGYGGMFRRWAQNPKMGPYNSWGNGAAMRVSSVAYLVRTKTELLDKAKAQAEVSHNHPDAIKGAQAVALTMWKILRGEMIGLVRTDIAREFRYNLNQTVNEIRPAHKFDVSCKGTVPIAIICAFEATSYEDAIRNAISLGGDSDTLACITGGIAETIFGLPNEMAKKGKSYLTDNFNAVLNDFEIRRMAFKKRH